MSRGAATYMIAPPAQPTLSPANWPEVICGDCGHTGPARIHGGRLCRTPKNASCGNCGEPASGLSRDGIPWVSWLTLVDNEDSEGRVPKDPAWTPGR